MKIFLIVFYLLMSAFTYGYAVNRKEDFKAYEIEKCALYASVVWPIYWPYHISRVWQEDKN